MLVLAIPIFRFASLIFLVSLIIILYVLFKFWKSATGFSAKTNELLKDIDTEYGDFMRKRINLVYLEGKDLKSELTEMKSEAMIILKPRIHALLHHLDSNDRPEIRLKYKPAFFSGLPALLESKFINEDLIFTSIEESIEASISARILDLKTGENLSF